MKVFFEALRTSLGVIGNRNIVFHDFLETFAKYPPQSEFSPVKVWNLPKSGQKPRIEKQMFRFCAYLWTFAKSSGIFGCKFGDRQNEIQKSSQLSLKNTNFDFFAIDQNGCGKRCRLFFEQGPEICGIDSFNVVFKHAFVRSCVAALSIDINRSLISTCSVIGAH